MNWHEEYDSLTEKDKRDFSRLVSLLFEQTFLVRDVWDVKEHRTATNWDYRFAERNLPLLKGYLSVGGFEVQVDGRRGVIALYNRFNHNRMKVDKLTTYLLYALRLVYEEQMETSSMRREIVLPLREIIGKLHAIGLLDKRVGITNLKSAINRLRKLSILAKVEGSIDDLDSRWMIYPTISLAVSDERINDLYARMLSGELAEGEFGNGSDEIDETDEADDMDNVDEIESEGT